MEHKNELNELVEFPTLTSKYIIYKRNNSTVNEIIYHKDISGDEEIEKIWLHETDTIVNIVDGRNFKINETLMMIQRYIHNDINIAYKDVIDVEILYSEINREIKSDINNENLNDINNEIKNNLNNQQTISRYPNIGRESIDFEATIVDTLIDCEIRRENIINYETKIYVFVRINDSVSNRISELVNRYLFIENKENEINNLHYNVPHYYNPFNNLRNSYYNQEIKRDYNNRILNLERQREQELDSIRRIFENRNDISIIYEEKSNDNLFIDNILNILLYTNGISNIENLEHLMEPVRVTVDENDLSSFITSFNFNFKLPDEIKIKNQETCTICLSNYEEGESVSYLNTCNHLFHTTCIKKWLSDFNHKCPVCRLSANPAKN